MASYQNFEEAIQKGIDVKDEIKYGDYVRNKKAVVDQYTEAAEDNFYGVDNKTITESMELLTELNEMVKESNIVYSDHEEYSELMDTILEDMESLKQKKTSIDSSLIGDAIDRYNKNFEAAKIAYDNHLLYKACVDYNKNPITTCMIYKDRDGEIHEVTTYKEVNGVLKEVSATYKSSWKYMSKNTYDLKIGNIVDDYGNPVKKEERSYLVNINKTLQAKLKRVGKLDSNYKMPTKPEDV